jgi:5-methylcytosine-specific restriction endonuclease McrA
VTLHRPCIGLPGRPCGTLVARPASRCAACAQATAQARGSATDRGYDTAWRKVRLQVLHRDRWTCMLALDGCLGRATTVDHLTPLSRGGARLDPGNLVAACTHCNPKKGTK